MTHKLEDYRRVFGSAIAATGLCLAACALVPMSQTVAPGSTIMVPVFGERLFMAGASTEYHIGFASPGGSVAITDPERGSLFALMCPSGSTTTMSDCQANASKVALTVRYVTRVYPDPASQAGIDNLVDDFPSASSTVPMSGQVLAFLDVPASLNSIFGTCTATSAPPSCYATYSYSLYLGIHLPSGADDVSSLFTITERRVTVVRGSGIPNQNETLYPNFPPNLERYVPFPKCVFLVSAGAANQVAGADMTITFPSSVTVKDVIEEEHLGRHTMLRWKTLSPTSISVSLTSPDKQVNRIAVVFALTNGQPAVAASAFVVSSSVLYNDQGYPLTGSFSPQVIR